MTGKTFGKVIAFVAICFVIILVFGVISKYTSGFTSSFKTFYIQANGKDIFTTASNYVLSPEEELHVEVRYTFTNENEEFRGYNVKIVPNKVQDNDFNVVTSTGTYSFQAEEDYTKAFDIQKYNTYFTIQPKGDLNDTLSSYFGSEVEDCTDNAYDNMFILVVSSYNEESIVTIYFTIGETQDTGQVIAYD